MKGQDGYILSALGERKQQGELGQWSARFQERLELDWGKCGFSGCGKQPQNHIILRLLATPQVRVQSSQKGRDGWEISEWGSWRQSLTFFGLGAGNRAAET